MTTELNSNAQDDQKIETEEMTPSVNPAGQENPEINMQVRGGSSNAVYGLGLIGAWVFYIGRATSFRQGIQGFFKGLFWPAFLVYELLKFLDKE